MKRKQLAWLLAVAFCCCGVQAEAAQVCAKAAARRWKNMDCAWQGLRRCTKDTKEGYQRKEAVRAYRRLAELYANDLHDDAKALECYEALLRLELENGKAHLQRARLLSREGRDGVNGA